MEAIKYLSAHCHKRHHACTLPVPISERSARNAATRLYRVLYAISRASLLREQK